MKNQHYFEVNYINKLCDGIILAILSMFIYYYCLQSFVTPLSLLHPSLPSVFQLIHVVFSLVGFSHNYLSKNSHVLGTDARGRGEVTLYPSPLLPSHPSPHPPPPSKPTHQLSLPTSLIRVGGVESRVGLELFLGVEWGGGRWGGGYVGSGGGEGESGVGGG